MSQKLPKGIFKEIEIGEVKKFLKENKGVFGVKELVRGNIFEILDKKKKKNISKKDFDLIVVYVENIKDYQKILKEITPYKNFSINFVGKLIFGQTKEEFRRFVNKESVRDVLEFGEEKNVEKIIDLCKDAKELEDLLNNENIDKLIYLINSPKENIELFFGENGIIKTGKELEDLLNHENIDKLIYLIRYGKKENIELFFGENGIIRNKEELEDLLNNENIDKIIDLINSPKENIELFFGENFYNIKTKEELEDLLNNENIDKIIDLIEYGKKENIELFFGENFYNIKTKEELEDLLNNKNIDKIIDLINSPKEKIEIFFGENGIIKTKEELEDLLNYPDIDKIIDLIKDSRKGVIELLLKYLSSIGDLTSGKFLKMIYQNKYIQDEDNILLGDYKKIDNIDILEFIQKYKNKIGENLYLGDLTYKGDYRPFSLIDLKVGNKLTGEQTRSKKHNIGEQIFWDINVKDNNITEEVQLAVNRLFAPFFPMTRLIKLVNGKINYVSIDVEENKHGVELNMLKEGISEEINKFFIMIYQFLTVDYDRHKGHNLGERWIIYDFDLIFNFEGHLYFFNNIFDNEDNFEEMGEILYTLKDYLTNEVDEVLKYYKQENKEDVVKVFKILRTRLDMLNFSNLIYYNKQVNPKIKEFAKKIDNKHYPIEKE